MQQRFEGYDSAHTKSLHPAMTCAPQLGVCRQCRDCNVRASCDYGHTATYNASTILCCGNLFCLSERSCGSAEITAATRSFLFAPLHVYALVISHAPISAVADKQKLPRRRFPFPFAPLHVHAVVIFHVPISVMEDKQKLPR